MVSTPWHSCFSIFTEGMLYVIVMIFSIWLTFSIWLIQVDSEWVAGRYDEAYAASRMARNLNLIGLFCHVAVWVVVVIVIVSVNA